MRLIDEFVNIRKAALMIGHDNGMINRENSVEDFLGKTEVVLGAEGVYYEDVEALDGFLERLSSAEFDTLCCGEELERLAIEGRAPKNARGELVIGLLDDIYNGVPS